MTRALVLLAGLLAAVAALAFAPEPAGATATACAAPAPSVTMVATPVAVPGPFSGTFTPLPVPGCTLFTSGAPNCPAPPAVGAVPGAYCGAPIPALSGPGVPVGCSVTDASTGRPLPGTTIVVGLDQAPYDGAISSSEGPLAYASYTIPSRPVIATVSSPVGAVRPIAYVLAPGGASVAVGCAAFEECVSDNDESSLGSLRFTVTPPYLASLGPSCSPPAGGTTGKGGGGPPGQGLYFDAGGAPACPAPPFVGALAGGVLCGDLYAGLPNGGRVTCQIDLPPGGTPPSPVFDPYLVFGLDRPPFDGVLGPGEPIGWSEVPAGYPWGSVFVPAGNNGAPVRPIAYVVTTLSMSYAIDCLPT